MDVSYSWEFSDEVAVRSQAEPYSGLGNFVQHLHDTTFLSSYVVDRATQQIMRRSDDSHYPSLSLKQGDRQKICRNARKFPAIRVPPRPGNVESWMPKARGTTSRHGVATTTSYSPRLRFAVLHVSKKRVPKRTRLSLLGWILSSLDSPQT